MDNQQLYMNIGALTAQVKALSENAEKLQRALEKRDDETEGALERIDKKLEELTRATSHLSLWKESADLKLVALGEQQGRLKSVVERGAGFFALMVTIFTLIGAGLWQIVIHWGDLGPFWALFGGKKQ